MQVSVHVSTASSLTVDSQAPNQAATPSDLACKLENMSIQSQTNTSVIPEALRTESHTEQQSSHRNDIAVPVLKSYFINVFDEPSYSTEEMLSHELQLMKEYQKREGVCLAEWQDESTGGR